MGMPLFPKIADQKSDAQAWSLSDYRAACCFCIATETKVASQVHIHRIACLRGTARRSASVEVLTDGGRYTTARKIAFEKACRTAPSNRWYKVWSNKVFIWHHLRDCHLCSIDVTEWPSVYHYIDVCISLYCTVSKATIANCHLFS